MKISILLIFGFSALAEEYVPAHYRADGAYVPPHYRRSVLPPKPTVTFATVNPYTGAGIPASDPSAQIQAQAQARQQRQPVKQPATTGEEVGGARIDGVAIPPAHLHVINPNLPYPVYSGGAAAPANTNPSSVSDHMTRVEPVSPQFNDVQH